MKSIRQQRHPISHDLMKNVVAVQAQVIWDIGNEAQDDQGNPDASELSAGDWSKLIDAASKVRQASSTLAQSDHVLAKDAAKLFDVSGSLDQVCENCHMQFWYPQR